MQPIIRDQTSSQLLSICRNAYTYIISTHYHIHTSKQHRQVYIVDKLLQYISHMVILAVCSSIKNTSLYKNISAKFCCTCFGSTYTKSFALHWLLKTFTECATTQSQTLCLNVYHFSATRHLKWKKLSTRDDERSKSITDVTGQEKNY